jgi:class 3 adenylate cyclase/tetratricopeptide (TPR) repeat protein
MASAVANILKRLDAPGADVLDLLPAYRTNRAEQHWRRDPALYRAFGRKLIDTGHPTRAVELIRQGLEQHPESLDLKYLLALAFSRSGNIGQSRRYLDELLNLPHLPPRLQIEAHSLEGRDFKDRYARAREPALKMDLAAKSAACYLRAAEVSGTTYPLINAATMLLLAGNARQARDLAATVIHKAKAELRQPGRERDYWLAATFGEAYLIRGDQRKMRTWLVKAIRLARGDVGSISSMRRNILLLKQRLRLNDAVWELFNVGSVVAFSGHCIDSGKGATRFPANPALERRVSETIRDKLAALNATVGYCSAASGSDLLFAERMLERNAELHIVLPFHKDDFYRTSVDYGLSGMSGWRARCDAVLARAKHVHYTTTEPYLGDDVLFDFANVFLQGLALTRAAERGTTANALTVLDPAAAGVPGGTAHFLQRWKKNNRKWETIDLARLRSEVGGLPDVAEAPVAARGTMKGARVKRQVKVMLFADVKGFSKLREEHFRLFFFRFLEEVTGVLRATAIQPNFCNTWGDGLYLVFDEVVEAAEVALRLLERIERLDWQQWQLAEPLSLRVGLHAGPVYRHKDPLIGRYNYFGSHVCRAARIEPVTTPGCAFASEQFAAALAVEPSHDFVCEFIGIEELAKGYDRCPLYRLGRC